MDNLTTPDDNMNNDDSGAMNNLKDTDEKMNQTTPDDKNTDSGTNLIEPLSLPLLTSEAQTDDSRDK